MTKLTRQILILVIFSGLLLGFYSYRYLRTKSNQIYRSRF